MKETVYALVFLVIFWKIKDKISLKCVQLPCGKVRGHVTYPYSKKINGDLFVAQTFLIGLFKFFNHLKLGIQHVYPLNIFPWQLCLTFPYFNKC